MENWWEYDLGGLEEKLRLLIRHNKSPKDIERVYSHGSRAKVSKVFTGQQKLEL